MSRWTWNLVNTFTNEQDRIHKYLGGVTVKVAHKNLKVCSSFIWFSLMYDASVLRV